MCSVQEDLPPISTALENNRSWDLRLPLGTLYGDCSLPTGPLVPCAAARLSYKGAHAHATPASSRTQLLLPPLFPPLSLLP